MVVKNTFDVIFGKLPTTRLHAEVNIIFNNIIEKNYQTKLKACLNQIKMKLATFY